MSKDLNPFVNAKTTEEREKVWKSLRGISKPISKEEANKMMQESIRLQQSKNSP